MAEEFHISTDRSLLDLRMIGDFLSKRSYWAQGRSMTTIEKSIRNSLCFGVYRGKETAVGFQEQVDFQKQVGFARVVTDKAVFAWIMDVFILENYRGKGLGKLLMSSIMEHPSLQGLQRWGLSTEDAHGLYEQFGFRALSKPSLMMEIVNPPR